MTSRLFTERTDWQGGAAGFDDICRRLDCTAAGVMPSNQQQTCPDQRPQMRVAIVENTAVTHHGQVGVALHLAGARIDLFKPWRDGVLPDMADHDALVVFGGEQNALDDATHSYLPRLAALMFETALTGTAVLGVCLGSQLLARGAGAQNHIGTTREFGWCAVDLTPAARRDPVLAHLPPRFDIFEWHSDTFTLPPNAVHLATSPNAANQCFRIGRAGYGMQFHFEASRAVVADWSRTFPELMYSLDPAWHTDHPTRAQTTGVGADAHGLAIAQAWVAMI